MTSSNIIFTHWAYALGPVEEFRGSREAAGHTWHTPGVVNTRTLGEIRLNEFVNEGEPQMTRLIYTFNEDTICESLSNLIGVRKEYIQYYIARHGINYVKEGTITKVNLVEVKNFLNENHQSGDFSFDFDEVTIQHLTTRINRGQGEILYNLFDALTQKTELQLFLNAEGLTFQHKGKKLLTFFNGNIVDWSEYFDGIWGPTARMISNRFQGNSFGTTDKCVNGFLFNGDIYNNTNVSHTKFLPEIVENILRVLGRENAIQKWRSSAKPYIITFKSKVENIIFDQDGKHKLNNKQKKHLIIKYCLYYLSLLMFNEWDQNDNPIIRLKDEISVPASDIHEVVLIANQ